jgi:sulfotransferase family protein
MALRVVGAGVGRTGTASLKLALERLLGGPCFHMGELFEHPELTPRLQAAARDEDIDWADLLPGYVATVDWPACAFWRQLADANPGAPVLLSTRESSEKWWESYSGTILQAMTAPVPPEDEAWMGRRALMTDLMPNTFSRDWETREGAIAGYERHNAAVRAAIPAERLIDYRAGDGWEPICAALGVDVPDEPFPHTNTTAQFRERSDAVD